MATVAHGLFTWQDGRAALEPCLRSTAGHVDHLIVADGLIDGVDPAGLPGLSDLAWLADTDWLPSSVPINAKRWRTLSAACTWILATARELEADWLLYVDADQELHNGADLRQRLEVWPGDVYPIPRQDGPNRHACPWQALRVSAFRRYVAGCFVVETAGGDVVSLVPHAGPDRATFQPAGAPWISHHPERRPPWRRGHRLGQLETILEPPPAAPALAFPSLLIQPADVTAAGSPEWYCDQCGARYHGPGVCSNQHPARELAHDDDNFPADAGHGGEQAPDAAAGASDGPAGTEGVPAGPSLIVEPDGPTEKLERIRAILDE